MARDERIIAPKFNTLSLRMMSYDDNFELPCDVNFECITPLLHCFHLFTCNYLALLIVTLNGGESRLSSSFC